MRTLTYEGVDWTVEPIGWATTGDLPSIQIKFWSPLTERVVYGRLSRSFQDFDEATIDELTQAFDLAPEEPQELGPATS